MNKSALFYIICISLNLLFPWMRSYKIWNHPVTLYFFMVQWEKEIKAKFHQPHEWITTLYIKSYLVFHSIAKNLTFTLQWSYAFKSILKAATWNNFKCSFSDIQKYTHTCGHFFYSFNIFVFSFWFTSFCMTWM